MTAPLIYRIGDLTGVLGLSKWTVYDLMKKVTFPDPFNLR